MPLSLPNKILYKSASWIAKSVDHYSNSKWRDFPFGDKPLADEAFYIALAEQSKKVEYPEVDEFERASEYDIDRDWMDELALHTQVTKKSSTICYPHGRLLYSALRSYLNTFDGEYVNIVESGTARGFSSLCMAKALHDHRIDGKILTYDVLPHDVKMYWNCVDDLQGPKSRAELLENYTDLIGRYIIYQQGDTYIQMPKTYVPRVNFAFLDGVHTYKYVLKEFESIYVRQQPGDILFYDDYTSSAFPEVVEVVDKLCEEHGYSKKHIRSNEERAYMIATKL